MKARVLRGGWKATAIAVSLGALSGAALAVTRLASDGMSRGARTAADKVAPGELHDAAQQEAAREAAAERDCLAERQRAAALPALTLPPSAGPELRAQLLGRTKGVPVLFLAEPPADMSEPARGLRAELEATPGYESFGRVVGKVRKDPALARAVFLRDGYLYTENPELAVLYGSLTLSLLFRDSELRIARGAEELFARRLDDGDYEYTSGDERGRRAKLLLFDRVSAAEHVFSASLQLDLRGVARELGFDELFIRQASAEYLVADAVYAGARVPLLLRVSAGEVALVCEAPGAERARMQARRLQMAHAEQAQARLVTVIKEQVDEGLPFDEPKTEDGQQDGKLRPEWRRAYLNGSQSFEFNGDRYAVFDESGRPRPPQVCIDFVLDTFERASGTWWKPLGQGRERVQGRLSFDDTGMENRRSVERFLEFARAHPESFEVYDPPAEARVALRNRAQFFDALYRARAEFRRGDIVAILGPRDDEKLHYHSFIIVGSDPLSGMPTELAANAGRPRIRSWEGEMSNAPRRSIFSRVRPRQPWLQSFLGPGGSGVWPSVRQTDVSAEPPAAGEPRERQLEPLGPEPKRPAAG